MDELTHTGPIWVPGHPVPKGSMKCIAKHAPGHRAKLVPDERADPDGWVNRVMSHVGLKAPHLVNRPLNGPIELVADFYLKRTKTTEFPEAPMGKDRGDLDKFVRMVGDALTDLGSIKDDSRITRIVAEKLYAAPDQKEGAWIELRPATPAPATPRGALPVRVQIGRVNALVGSLDGPEGLPNLLRQVADRLEKKAHERGVSDVR